jgi:cytochrome bd-type quinol oxidase subunit 2
MSGLTKMAFTFFAGAQLDCLSSQGGTGVTNCDTGLPTAQATGDQLHSLLQIVFAIFAVVTVLMIVIAGMNYIYAEGDPQKAAKARSTIIYSIVGLVVAVSAEVIVTFVVGSF